MSTYDRIAELIAEFDTKPQAFHRNQVGKTDLLPADSERLLRSWSGISAEDFFESLGPSRVKALLGQNRIAVAGCEEREEAPAEFGDLLISLQPASPQEIRSKGAALQIAYGFSETPFGECLLAKAPKGICFLVFVDDQARDAAFKELQSLWPNADIIRDDSVAKRWSSIIFAKPGSGERHLAPLYVRGTDFQVRVWRAMLRIRYGSLATYGQLAAALGQPTASRAVGSAVGSNNISWLIPCHRVIRGGGAIGDYRWNPIRKRAMIIWESSSAGLPGQSRMATKPRETSLVTG